MCHSPASYISCGCNVASLSIATFLLPLCVSLLRLLIHNCFEKLMSALIWLKLALTFGPVALFTHCWLYLLMFGDGRTSYTVFLSQVDLLESWSFLLDCNYTILVVKRVCSWGVSTLLLVIRCNMNLGLLLIQKVLDLAQIDLPSLLRSLSIILKTTYLLDSGSLLLHRLRFLGRLIYMTLDNLSLDRWVVEACHR